jgi:hypothetical protein
MIGYNTGLMHRKVFRQQPYLNNHSCFDLYNHNSFENSFNKRNVFNVFEDIKIVESEKEY